MNHLKKKKPKLLIDWCSHKAAKFACENWHYSKCIPKSKLAKFGVWENDKFIGSIIYGVGATSSLVQRFGLQHYEGCELVRIALKNHVHEVTKMVSITLSLLKKKFTGLELVVSFADPEKGHEGKIYKAGNWIYSGRTQASDEYIYKGKRWQGRSFRNSYKGMEKHPDVKIVKGSSKHRFLMPLKNRSKYICATSKVSLRPSHQMEEGGEIPTVSLQKRECSQK